MPDFMLDDGEKQFLCDAIYSYLDAFPEYEDFGALFIEALETKRILTIDTGN